MVGLNRSLRVAAALRTAGSAAMTASSKAGRISILIISTSRGYVAGGFGGFDDCRRMRVLQGADNGLLAVSGPDQKKLVGYAIVLVMILVINS